MAKKNIKKAENVAEVTVEPQVKIEPEVEVKMEEVKEEEPEIKVEKPVNNKPSKLYTIKVKQYTRVVIGEWDTFEPNKVYRVEEHIKSRLQNAGLLARV